VLFFASHPRSFRSSNALTIREEMAMATERMVATAPMFGVGIGQYLASSPAFMSSRARSWYPAQNAHNQFLQVLGELGFTGLLVFGTLLALALGSSTRHVLARAVQEGATGAVVGLLGFLVTSLTMHPLLVPEAGMVFWILLGVARGSGSTRVPSWLEEAALWWMALLILTLPLRVESYLR
jgi:O-antigen ligase